MDRRCETEVSPPLVRTPFMRLACPATVLCLLGGCTEPTASMEPPTVAPPPTASAPVQVIPGRAAAAEPSVPVIPLAEIGMPAVPSIATAARARNRAALKLHRAEDFAAARDGFVEALALSPDHDMARYNLACAQARLGDLAAARAELETVLHRDLLRFQGRWRGARPDTDLDALRQSANAPAIDALVEALRVAYDHAHDVGVAAYSYSRPPSPEQTDFAGTPVDKGSSSLVSGIWLHADRRFVPLARGGTVALLDLPRRRALRAKVRLDEAHCDYDISASIELVSTHPDPTVKPKGSVRKAKNGDRGFDAPGNPSFGFVGGDGVLTHDGPLTFEGTWVDVLAEGGKFHAAPPPGYSLQHKTLTVPGRQDPIALDRAYEHVFATGAPAAPVFLLHRRFDIDYDTFDPIFDATVVRLDVSSGKTERIAHGNGDAWVVIGTDGSVYIELEGQTQRWADADAGAPEPTMPGLHLAMPIDAPGCMCCG